jgi:hypothetical protein
MTPEERGEVYRGGIHAVVGGLVLALFLYQVIRIAEHGPERHLVVNALVYGPLALYEHWQTLRHWRHAG